MFEFYYALGMSILLLIPLSIALVAVYYDYRKNGNRLHLGLIIVLLLLELCVMFAIASISLSSIPKTPEERAIKVDKAMYHPKTGELIYTDADVRYILTGDTIGKEVK